MSQIKANGRALERHVQTALVVLIVALLTWMASTIHENSLQLAAVAARLESIRETDKELYDVEKRLARVEAELAALRTAIEKN